jgi:K+-sensing histidine kinase KdpD
VSPICEIVRIAPNELLQSALSGLGESLVRRRIRLVKKLAPDLPRLVLDVAQIREALGHLLKHSVDSLSPGGRLRVESRKVPGHVLFEIAHDGAAAPGDGLEQLLAAFAMPGALGVPSLAAAERIVRRHGGEIRTRRQGEWSSVIAFSLPIRGNQDRRRAPIDRRGQADRRARFPEALNG